MNDVLGISSNYLATDNRERSAKLATKYRFSEDRSKKERMTQQKVH